MRKYITLSIFLTLLLGLGNLLFAQSAHGKLAGTVTDAETGEALIGANVILLNTSKGAATDIDGRYFILNITPGTYDVQLSFVGYGKKIIQDVRIVSGITYELNASLTSGLKLDEIVVTDKKFFEEKSTNTVKVVDADDIAKLPVRGVSNIASLQAGVVVAEGSGGADGEATINVRGGRGGEVLYIIDGVPQNDAYFGGNFAQVSNASVDQISFQIGGFEAKYGQAQSGIINVTTKAGSPTYSLHADVITSEFTDNYGYNLYTATFGGPIVPGVKEHTFFLSGERGWFLDGDPRAIPVEIPTIGYSSDVKPNMQSGLYRITARTTHDLNPVTLRFGANLNFRDARNYIHSYVKNNSHHNPRQKDDNLSFSARISHTLSNSSFWNLNAGYKIYKRETGDGLLFDDIQSYGDPTRNPELVNVEGDPIFPGSRVGIDDLGSFFRSGRVSNQYDKAENSTLNLDLDFTNQAGNHLIEAGAGLSYNNVRRYVLFPAKVAENQDLYTLEERLAQRQPLVIGYDVFGNKSDEDVSRVIEDLELPISTAAKNPYQLYFYAQDRFELDDLVINLGFRFDYFDAQQDILADETLPFANGDPTLFDDADFVEKDPEFNISPRLGFGFPVTESTVFHAQYGVFIQPPTLNNIVTSFSDLNPLLNDNNFPMNTGNLESETTTQYEIGLRQILGDNAAALNITAYYKNIKGLTNFQTVFFQRTEGGAFERYYRPTNADFGTVKGLAFSLAVNQISYFSLNVDYTYSISEGTGSSTNSSTTAAFRNQNGETPIVIAPLDYDQRHTGVASLSMNIPEGDLGFLEMTSLSLIYSFNSGRPYTPLQSQNLEPGGASNLGDTKGYVNSAFGPGTSRLDLKLEKPFKFAEDFYVIPYLWVENVFDVDNAVTVYRSTGSPYTTDYLSTSEGSAKAAQIDGYADDYVSLERNPFNFGIPRLIKLGVKINFSNFGI